MLGRNGEESGTTAVAGAQETGQGSRYCGTIGNQFVYQTDAFLAARRFIRQVILRSKVLAINQKAMGPGHENCSRDGSATRFKLFQSCVSYITAAATSSLESPCHSTRRFHQRVSASTVKTLQNFPADVVISYLNAAINALNLANEMTPAKAPLDAANVWATP